MVLAARLRGIPAALTEADAHLGLANRLAAPFARRVFLAYAIPGRDGRKYRVVGRPIPSAHLGLRQGRRTRALRPPARPPGARGLRRARGRAGAERVRRRSVRRARASDPARVGRAGLRRRCGRACTATTTSSCRRPITSAPRSRRPTSRSRERAARVWELAAAGTPAILVPYPHATADHQTLNARHFAEGGGAIVVDQSELAQVPALVEGAARGPARLARMSDAMIALARAGRGRDRRRRAPRARRRGM